MNIALGVAVIGAAVSIAGWVANYALSMAADKRRQRVLFQLEFTKQQLEELYGPLAFLVLEGQQSFPDLLDVLGRNYVFTDSAAGEELPLPDDELQAWLFWVEYDFLPRHHKIRDLLSNKAHLIDSVEVPRSFLDYLNHINSWRIHHERWRKLSIPYSWHSKVNFPRQFESDVLSAFENLQQRHSKQLGNVGPHTRRGALHTRAPRPRAL